MFVSLRKATAEESPIATLIDEHRNALVVFETAFHASDDARRFGCQSEEYRLADARHFETFDDMDAVFQKLCAAPPRALLPGHPDFGEAVSLVREARLSMGKAAALAIWRGIGLPWVAELDQRAAPEGDDDDDPVVIFTREAVERAPGVVTPSVALYAGFADFCRRRSLHDAGAASFQIRFARMGFSRAKSRGVRVYRNIRIKAEQSEMET